MDDDHDGYRGPATLTVDGREVPVRAILDARHEPQDGRLHWFGRVALDGEAHGRGDRRAVALVGRQRDGALMDEGLEELGGFGRLEYSHGVLLMT